MGLPYRLRDVDLVAGVESDAELLEINPAVFFPAIRDGDVTMVESVTIMEYLLGRYGPTTLAPGAQDAAFPAYQQFLHLDEAGLATAIFFVSGARNIAPESGRDNWSARQTMDVFTTRLQLVTRRQGLTPYLAGDVFTAADISVGYALEMARKNVWVLGDAEQVFMARLRERRGYQRALAACHATRGWWMS